jgi:hypothetical protein
MVIHLNKILQAPVDDDLRSAELGQVDGRTREEQAHGIASRLRPRKVPLAHGARRVLDAGSRDIVPDGQVAQESVTDVVWLQRGKRKTVHPRRDALQAGYLPRAAQNDPRVLGAEIHDHHAVHVQAVTRAALGLRQELHAEPIEEEIVAQRGVADDSPRVRQVVVLWDEGVVRLLCRWQDVMHDELQRFQGIVLRG